MVVREESTTGGEESGIDGRELSSPNSVLSMTVSSPLHVYIPLLYITMYYTSRVKNRGRVFTTYAYLRFPVQGSHRHH